MFDDKRATHKSNILAPADGIDQLVGDLRTESDKPKPVSEAIEVAKDYLRTRDPRIRAERENLFKRMLTEHEKECLNNLLQRGWMPEKAVEQVEGYRVCRQKREELGNVLGENFIGRSFFGRWLNRIRDRFLLLDCFDHVLKK